MARTATVTLDASVRICVFHGHDQMIQRLRLEQLQRALEKEHDAVQITILDGRTVALAEVFDELRGYSLLAPYKLIVVDAADEFIKNHREAMQRYAAEPVDHATLVLRGPKWHKGNLDKLIARVGAVIKCDVPSVREARQWLIARATAEYRLSLDLPLASELVDRLGPDLMKLDSELAKLAVCAGPDGKIGRQWIEQLVGRSSDEQAWTVQETILQLIKTADAAPALAQVHEMVQIAGQPALLVLYFVADLLRKLSVAAAMQRASTPPEVIAQQLRLWGSRQKLFFDALDRLGHHRIDREFTRIVDLDRRAKSGLGDHRKNLECFCVNLADILE